MEKLEVQKEIIELGNLIVRQLNLENSSDTLGRWMAHYIAETMTKAKNARGKAKVLANETCTKTILEVWKHRWEIKEISRPFRNFDRILELIQKMDPEATESYFYTRQQKSVKTGDNPWLKAAEETDKAARVCLEYIYTKAADEASTPRTVEVINATDKIGNESDIALIKLLLDGKDLEQDSFPPEKGGFNSAYRSDSIEKRIEQLDVFTQRVNEIRDALIADLEVAKTQKLRDSH